MIWEYVIPAIFGVAILVQCIYLLFVFTALIRHKNKEEEPENFPGVSVVIAAWNELYNLQELLPMLDSQDYLDFEIIVVDDRSSDGTYDYLRTNEGNFKNVQFVHVKALPEHFTAKKYAVTMGIKKATKELVLLTDADCRPNSDQWIRKMALQNSDGADVVLGFSPYYKYPGVLNAFIRYETLQTAIQYLSFAKSGFPFMGVGRNLMYKRENFWKVNGFTTHLGLLSGDDDLLVNAMANRQNTGISTDPDTYMYSEPKLTYKDWVTQKRRHLSVGKRYKFRDKLTIGLLWFSFIFSWLFVVPAFFAGPEWFILPEWLKVTNEWLEPYGFEQYTPYSNWMRVITGVFLGWQFLRWLILYLCNKKLSFTVNSWKLPYLDFLYLWYLLIFGIVTVFSNPKKIKWR
ncbi:glycosyltransferase [Jiulongibacter sediminis]|uniref:glycosyltransferase n=1 Tax=Jiulongibacter sediminis TaxID=1605367 RepID=UPI0006DCE659|nr:glycosyltransferase [Jiulongibacter sediminis]